MFKKWFRMDNWSLSVAKIVGILWILASIFGPYFFIQPMDTATWIAAVVWTVVLILIGIMVGYLILVKNWESH